MIAANTTALVFFVGAVICAFIAYKFVNAAKGLDAVKEMGSFFLICMIIAFMIFAALGFIVFGAHYATGGT